MEENELSQRLFRFAVDVIRMLKPLRGGEEVNIVRSQLIKAASSSGANYEESQTAVSKADFANKVGISLKEMRESNYWLRILKELYTNNMEILRLSNESCELKRILASICIKVSSRQKSNFISKFILLFPFSFFLFP